MMFIKTILLSMKRRKKEIRFVSMVTFIAVFCMSSVSLFQNVMNQYLMEKNYHNYGEWVLSAVNRELNHPYLSISGVCNTGEELLNEEGMASGEYLGSVDDYFIDLGHLFFYEGRMPENEHEIVMTLEALAEFGCSYDLGQTIHVTAGTSEAYDEKDFILVGTIKNFSGNWQYADGFPLPSCIVTQEALLSVGKIMHTTNFYQLDHKYADINVREFAAPFLQMSPSAFPARYNSYVYENQIWGSPEMLRNIQIILIVIAVLVISYLMMSYVTGRRRWYYQMRSTGAGKSQIWLAIFLEGIYGTIPWAVVALFLPYAIGAAVCYMAAKQMQLQNFFKVDVQVLLWQTIAVLGIIFTALVISCFSSSDRRLSSNVHEVKKRQLNRLRRAAKKKKNVAQSFYKRQNKMRPLQRMAMILFSIVACSFLGLCIHQLSKEYRWYKVETEFYNDFSATKYAEVTYQFIEVWVNEKGEIGEHENPEVETVPWIYDGMNEELETLLDTVEGLERIDKSAMDREHHLDWENREHSPVFQYFEQVDKGQGYVKGSHINREEVMATYIYEDYEQALKVHGQIIETKQIDEEAFRKGEQVLLLLFKGEFSYSTEDIRETAIQPGDVITMVNTELPAGASAEAAVISITEKDLYDKVAIASERMRYWQPYTLIASRAFAERMAAANGKEFQYNRIEIDFNRNSSFDSTTKRLAALFEEYGFQYGSSWEEKNMAREKFVQNLCAYGVLFCVMLAVYLLLQMNLNQIKNYERVQKYQMLKRLGMSDSFYLKMTIKEGLRDALWLLFGIPFSYGLFFLVEWLEVDKGITEYRVWSSWAEEYTQDPFAIVMGNIVDSTEIVYIVIFVILLMMAVTGIVYRSAKRSMKKTEIV